MHTHAVVLVGSCYGEVCDPPLVKWDGMEWQMHVMKKWQAWGLGNQATLRRVCRDMLCVHAAQSSRPFLIHPCCWCHPPCSPPPALFPIPTHPRFHPNPTTHPPTPFSPYPQVGADLCMGSLIKNPGGTIVSGGGYVAGRADLVERAVARLSAPGVGMDAGCVPGETLRLMFQGGWWGLCAKGIEGGGGIG